MDHLWIRDKDTEYGVPDNKHDKGYKYLLSAKKVFLQLLKSFVKQGWVDDIDGNNIMRVDKSFILQDFKDKEADLVYWVKMNNSDVIFYILMEMQSTVDFQMPHRLLLYMVQIWTGVLKDVKGGEAAKKGFRLPSVVPIVLYNGENNWTACKSYKEYLSGYEMFGNNILDFEYILIDVNRYENKELIEVANLISSVFLIDKTKGMNSLLVSLEKIIGVLKNLNENELELFKNWFKNIIIRGIEPKKRKEFENILEMSREGKDMISNVELMLKKEMKKNRN